MNNDILIIGLEKTGKSLIEFLQKNSHYGKIYIFDDSQEKSSECVNKYSNIEIINDPNDFHNNNIDLAICSPGFRTKYNPHWVVKLCQEKDIKIVSDVTFILDFYNYKNVIAITGSNGKSTTSSLVDFILNNNKVDSDLLGNIGKPISLLDKEKSFVVVETSSAMLEISPFLASISAITNIESHHTDYHGDFLNYVLSKLNIIDYSEKTLINYDDLLKNQQKNPEIYSLIKNKINNNSEKIKYFSTEKILELGYSLVNNLFYINNIPIYNLNEVIKKSKLIGKHNISNICVAIAAVIELKICDQINLDCLIEFNPLPHRLELVMEFNSIKIINDSKSTNIIAGISALNSLDGKIVIICGGKLSNYSEITPLLNYSEKIEHIFLISDTSSKFSEELDLSNFKKYSKQNNLKNCLIEIKKMILKQKIDYLLFSPITSSLNEYSNFEHRGEVFTSMCKEIFTIN
jgi:UDP-N-acetylmuramoylalanine--D-glutamate ligase